MQLIGLPDCDKLYKCKNKSVKNRQVRRYMMSGAGAAAGNRKNEKSEETVCLHRMIIWMNF